MTLPLSNIVNISVQLGSSGLSAFNVNNIALFTTDSFLSNSAGNQYRYYQSPSVVGTDFGTTTETYQQANAIFAQQPNILAGSGQLIICPIQSGAITTATVGTAGSGYVVGDVLTIVQTGGQLGTVTVASTTGSGAVATITVNTPGIGYTVANYLTVTGGFGTGATINVTAVSTESLLQAINRLLAQTFFVGILSTSYGSSTGWLSLATSIQALGDKILYLPSSNISDIYGAFTQIQQGLLYNTRCLFYSTSALTARLYAASYAGLGQSVNFNGSNTAITMNLKQLSGVTVDPAITQTLFNACLTAGVDVYGGITNYPCISFSSGANKYFDEVFNLIWFVSSLKVSGFNALATTSTKLPQTEGGVSVLKTAYRNVCLQAVSNRYIAPGLWTSSEWFGVQQDFINNIANAGFYIYSQPINQQATSARTARQSPLIQIAIKESGSIQSTSVIVNVNP